MKKLALAGLLCLNSFWVFGGDFPLGDLTKGEHHVGFRVYHEYDNRRAFRPTYDEEGRIVREQQSRPMQVAVWYPTKQAGKKMQFRDYWFLNITREHFFDISDERKAQSEDAYINMWGMLGELDKEKMRKNLSIPMTAVKDAPFSSQKFPLIILAQRENRGAFINFQLAEYLASHGYFVAITPAKAKTDNSPQLNFWDQDGIQAGVADLQFVKGFMMSFPGVDKNKVGVVGYGFGATTALAMSQDDANISAVVSLAGIVGIENEFIKPTMETMNYFSDPNRFRTPLLHVGVNNMNGQQDRPFTLMQDIRFADVHHVDLKNVDEIAMGATFAMDWVGSLKEKDSYDYTLSEAEKAYDLASQSILAFLNYYVAQDNKNDPVSVLTEVNSTEVSSYDFKAGMTPPPGEDFFTDLFRESPKRAAEMFIKFHKQAPDIQFVSARTLGSLAQSLYEQQKFQRAKVAYELVTIGYPDRTWGFVGYGQSEAQLGNKQAAKEALDTAENMEIADWLKPEVEKLQSMLETD